MWRNKLWGASQLVKHHQKYAFSHKMIFLPFIFEKAKYFVLLNIFVPTLSHSTQLIRFTVVNEDLF